MGCWPSFRLPQLVLAAKKRAPSLAMIPILLSAVNNATSSVYYLSEKTSDYESRLKSLGESGYAEYVKTNGTQLSTSVATGPTGDSIYETTLTSLAFGKGSEYDLNATTFTGVLWNDVVAGTYRLMDNTNVIGAMGWGGRTKATTLQVSSIDSKKFRFKDLYGKVRQLWNNDDP